MAPVVFFSASQLDDLRSRWHPSSSSLPHNWTTSSAPRPLESSAMWNSTVAPTVSSVLPMRSFMLTNRPPLCILAFSCSISSAGVIQPYLPFHAATVPLNFSAVMRFRGRRWPLPPSLPLLPLPLALPPLSPPLPSQLLKLLITPFAPIGDAQPFAPPFAAGVAAQPFAAPPPQPLAPLASQPLAPLASQPFAPFQPLPPSSPPQ